MCTHSALHSKHYTNTGPLKLLSKHLNSSWRGFPKISETFLAEMGEYPTHNCWMHDTITLLSVDLRRDFINVLGDEYLLHRAVPAVCVSSSITVISITTVPFCCACNEMFLLLREKNKHVGKFDIKSLDLER